MERTVVAGLVVSVALFAAADSVRWFHLDRAAATRRASMKLEEDVLRSPGPEVLKLASFEHSTLFAELLWLQIVQELGKPAEGETASYDRLQRWSNIAVDLDEKYYTVYWTASLNLMVYAKRAASAEHLLQKGRRALPQQWEFPFLIGYIYFFLRGDAEAGAMWWEQTTRIPGSPGYLPALAGRARAVAGDRAGAIDLLESMLEELPPMQRQEAEIRLKILRSEPILVEYDQACDKYRAERGTIPADGNELHSAHYADTEPYDLLGKPIIFKGQDCRARTEYIEVRDDELRATALGRDGVAPDDKDPALEEK